MKSQSGHAEKPFGDHMRHAKGFLDLTSFSTLDSSKFLIIKKINYLLGTIHLRRRHVLGGEGGSLLPMFADARGVGVLGLPTSAIFEIINLHYRLLYIQLLSFILESI